MLYRKPLTFCFFFLTLSPPTSSGEEHMHSAGLYKLHIKKKRILFIHQMRICFYSSNVLPLVIKAHCCIDILSQIRSFYTVTFRAFQNKCSCSPLMPSPVYKQQLHCVIVRYCLYILIFYICFFLTFFKMPH